MRRGKTKKVTDLRTLHKFCKTQHGNGTHYECQGILGKTFILNVITVMLNIITYTLPLDQN